MRNISICLSMVLIGGSLSGCVVANAIDADETNVTSAGTPQVIGKSELYRVNLTDLVTKHGAGCVGAAVSNATDSEKLSNAFAAFTTCSNPDMATRRNAVQRYIMMSADRRCEVYKQSLSAAESNTSMAFGTIATVTGVLGGLFEESAQGLSAAAGISSGLNAEVSRSFFKDTSLSVIFSGIDMKRQDISAEIGKRRSQSLTEYSLAEAVSDAIRYNGACSAVEGMKHVSDTLAKPVGLAEARRVIAQANDGIQEVRISAEPDAAKRTELWQKLQAEREAKGKVAGLSEAPPDSGKESAPGAISAALGQLSMAQKERELLPANPPTPGPNATESDRAKAQAETIAIANADASISTAQGKLKDMVNMVVQTQTCLRGLNATENLADGAAASKFLTALGRQDAPEPVAANLDATKRQNMRAASLQRLAEMVPRVDEPSLKAINQTCSLWP